MPQLARRLYCVQYGSVSMHIGHLAMLPLQMGGKDAACRYSTPAGLFRHDDTQMRESETAHMYVLTSHHQDLLCTLRFLGHELSPNVGMYVSKNEESVCMRVSWIHCPWGVLCPFFLLCSKPEATSPSAVECASTCAVSSSTTRYLVYNSNEN